MTRSAEIRQALESIMRRNRKRMLKPAAVVDAARDQDSPLHCCFCWDDSKAANEYRLWQARQLIVTVRISLDGPKESICQAFVSLKPDRLASGYRHIDDVMHSRELHAELLKTALSELKVFQDRYGRFKELRPVFAAGARISRKFTLSTKPSR